MIEWFQQKYGKWGGKLLLQTLQFIWSKNTGFHWILCTNKWNQSKIYDLLKFHWQLLLNSFFGAGTLRYTYFLQIILSVSF